MLACCALFLLLSAPVPALAQGEGAPIEEDGRIEEEADDDELDEDELFERPANSQERDAPEQVGRRRVRRLDEQPLEQMDREDAQAAGFVFGDAQQESSRTSATFLAATAGLFAHGVGHWYLDEKRTAGILLAAQGASVMLMSSALAWQWLSDDSTASQVYSRPALYAGVGLFGLSYLLDVIGTMQSGEVGVPINSRRERGISLEAHYRYLNLESFGADTLQLLSAGTLFDLGWGYVGIRTDQDVYLDTSVYGGTLGGRPWRGPGRHTFVYVEADGEWLGYSGVGRFNRAGGELTAGMSLGLGNWISQLRHVAVGAAIGYGHHWYSLPVADDAEFAAGVSAGYVPFEMFVHFNLTEQLSARAAYEHREGAFLETSPAGLAVASIEFLYQSTDALDLVVRGEFGGGVGLSGGLRVWFWK
jgi:hypothetical protein